MKINFLEFWEAPEGFAPFRLTNLNQTDSRLFGRNISCRYSYRYKMNFESKINNRSAPRRFIFMLKYLNVKMQKDVVKLLEIEEQNSRT